jgi:ATP-dependent helicase/nuclease subunit B
VMILAGLNEGQWPQPATPDPWLAPVLRRQLGLAGLERQIGLSAHDFVTALGAPNVILTRAARSGSAPTVASRLRLRIDAMLGEGRPLDAAAMDYARIASALDACDAPKPFLRPAPSPPPAMRPRGLGVTEADTLLSDPFAFYARAGLGLFRIDPLDAAPSPAWRGTRVHDVLERWLKGDVQTRDEAVRLWRDLLASPGVGATLRGLWGPRLTEAVGWAADTVIAGRSQGRDPIITASEAKRSVNIDGITLTGKPDRIDRMPDGTLAIVDYKSGGKVNQAAMQNLHALQLGLLGAMAEMGAFTRSDDAVSTYEYWRLNKSPDKKQPGFGWIEVPFPKKGEPAICADNFSGEAWHRLERALENWLHGGAPFTALLHPDYAMTADYAHLARVEEWRASVKAEGAE